MNFPGNICDGCGLQYTLDKGNTSIHYYECQPWFSFGTAHCPQCHQVARLFWRDQDYMEYFILHDFTFYTDDFADDLTVKAFESVYGLKELQTVELTPRLEKEINALEDWLTHAPDEWITAMFEEQAPAPERPERWI